MSESNIKRKRGRPRKYSTDAERCAAIKLSKKRYYERNKGKLKRNRKTYFKKYYMKRKIKKKKKALQKIPTTPNIQTLLDNMVGRKKVKQESS